MNIVFMSVLEGKHSIDIIQFNAILQRDLVFSIINTSQCVTACFMHPFMGCVSQVNFYSCFDFRSDLMLRYPFISCFVFRSYVVLRFPCRFNASFFR